MAVVAKCSTENNVFCIFTLQPKMSPRPCFLKSSPRPDPSSPFESAGTWSPGCRWDTLTWISNNLPTLNEPLIPWISTSWRANPSELCGANAIPASVAPELAMSSSRTWTRPLTTKLCTILFRLLETYWAAKSLKILLQENPKVCKNSKYLIA